MTVFAAVMILLVFWMIDRHERKKKVRMTQLNESYWTKAPHPVNSTYHAIQKYLDKESSMEELYKYRAIADHHHADSTVMKMINDRIHYVLTH